MSGASARAGDPSLATAQECTRHLPTMERLYNIPAHWLAAIASTESGRYSPALRLSVPWPWTINVGGKGYWFDSKQEAVQAVQYYQSKGIKSIDVGCMQVNLMYHGQAFSNLSQAFEPIYNIAYAAKFLRENYNTMNSWTKATAAYHSMQSRRGADYYRKVYQKWQQVVDRLNESVFAPPVQQAIQNRQPERPPSSFAFRDPPGANGLPAKLPFHVATPPQGAALQPQQQVRMNSITVSRGNFPQPQPPQPNSIAIAANSNPPADIMQAAMPPAEALTPLDVIPQQPSGNTLATVSQQNREVIPPTRQYERGVLVIRANQGQENAVAQENQPAQVRLTAGEMPENRGQFAPRTVDNAGQQGGDYVTERPQPKTVTPKFVF